MRFPLFAALTVSAFLVGCGAKPRPPSTPVELGKTSEPTPFTSSVVVVSSDDDPGGTALEVFERAKDFLSKAQYAKARTLFDRVLMAERVAEPKAMSSLARVAAYNAALCSESLLEMANARDRYKLLAEGAPLSADALDSLLRRGRLDVEIEDWKDLGAASASLLVHPDIALFDRAEAHAFGAISAIAAHDLAAGEKALLAAQKIMDGTGEMIPPAESAAAVHFAWGDLQRARGLAITFVPTGPDFGSRIEARCQRILDGEDAYVEAIKTHDLRWAVRSGLRIATMYTALHDDLVIVPPPPTATTDAKKALFRGAIRLRYRILLEKGLSKIEHTLGLESTGVKSSWLEHVRQAKAKLEKTLADEKAEIAKLPYTEAELQRALDDVAKAPPKKP